MNPPPCVADMAGAFGLEGLAQVQGHLVAHEVEIDPGVGTAAFDAAEHIAVETAGFVEVGDFEGEVKEAFHAGSLSKAGVDGQGDP